MGRFHRDQLDSPLPHPIFSLIEDVAGLGDQGLMKVILRSACAVVPADDPQFFRFVVARIIQEDSQHDTFGITELGFDIDALVEMANSLRPMARIH